MTILPSLQQLRFLCALADHGHFGRAADSCAVTQSTLSGGIKELESRLGVDLVERCRRRVMPTPVGQEVVARARRLLTDAEELVEVARDTQEPLTTPLRLGVIPTIAPYALPSIIPVLGEKFPKLKLYVREDQTPALLDKLAAGELDVLLLALPYELGDVDVMDVGEDPIVVALPETHRLSGLRQIDRTDLALEPMILIEDGHCLRSHALQACRITGPVHNEVFQGTSLRTLLLMVSAGLGITLLPQLAVTAEFAAVPNLVTRPLAPGNPTRTLAIAWRRTSSRGPEFRTLGAFLKAGLTRRAGPP
jgi:LysR family transcriptional regulator, hydrogen peroxide-inducible genes activator